MAPGRPGRAQAAAEEFEGLLLAQLLKALRRTVPEGDDTGAMPRTYQELLDEQLAADLARKGGIGLAPLIRAYLEQAGPDSRGGLR
jgi:Rod binding domain-containing protein